MQNKLTKERSGESKSVTNIAVVGGVIKLTRKEGERNMQALSLAL